MTYRCSDCGKTKEANRPPMGWKHVGAEYYCRDCWCKRCVLRAITVPVVEPMNGIWKDLRAELSDMWRATTQASNWMMTEMYTRDTRRNGQEKMPAMERQYLYPEVRGKWPELPPQSVCSLEQAVQRKYRARRFDTIWTCDSSLPTFRYPQPFPVHNQSWSVAFGSGNRPIITARIGDRYWDLRLKGGSRYRRQLAAVRQMANGAATRGEAAFYRVGEFPDQKIMCKMVAWLPRTKPIADLDGTLFVRTGDDCLLRALDIKGNRVWIENADHVRRWVAEYRRTMQRLREDRKLEQRPVPKFKHHQDEIVQKQRHRIDSTVKEVAHHLTEFALRRKYAAIQYNDDNKGFAESFPYFAMRERIKTNLNEYGIRFEHASADVMPQEADSLAEGEDE